jgi:DDE superfamily endonuclease
MPTPQREPLRAITLAEQAALQRIVSASSERADQVRRATAVLAVAQGSPFIHAARLAGWPAEWHDRRRPGSTVQSLRAGGARDRGWPWAQADLHAESTCAHRRDRSTITQPTCGRHSDVVTEYPAAQLTQSQVSAARHEHDSACAARRRQFVPAHAYVVPDRHGAAEAQSRHRDGGRSADRGKKGLIELAYRVAEAAGVPVWCQDEAGPYQAIPQSGLSWRPIESPLRQPHEYIRGGTAKLLTLFRPATGEVRAKGVTNAPNVVLHPWLQREVLHVLAELPELPLHGSARSAVAQWPTWLGYEPRSPLPPLRLILIWDNLAGHLSSSIVIWLYAHGVMPLYTPLSGSWLNMAESIQRILSTRALAGQHPRCRPQHPASEACRE